ncbi:MAG: hypothetical protein JRF63_09145 [Deltaproteobacteria bacterium]|nr:hypothetical protein [Deltaproteobacteria bacterium]
MDQVDNAMSESAAGNGLKARLGRVAYPVALVVFVLVHLFLVFHFEQPSLIFAEEPIGWLDFDTHIEQVCRVTEALDGWGKSWAYDVQLLAGYPNGTIFDADNKGWELLTYALWKLGMPRGTAFNMFILLAHLLVPWVAFASARLFRLDKWACLVAMVLATALWYFDCFPHWCWWIGMIAWGIAGYLILLPLALLYRFLADGGWWRAVLGALSLAALLLVHPYGFVVLLLPMLALYVRAFRRIGWRRHLGVWAMVAFTLLTNAYWVVVAVRFWHYILDSGYCFQGGLSYILTDYLGLMGADPLVSGVLSNRSFFRVVGIAGAVICLVLWRRERDDRFLPFAVGAGAMFALTYLGANVWITQQIQPYRFVLPAMYLTVIPAAAFIVRVVRSEQIRKLPRLAYVVLGLMIFIAVPAVARDVLYYFPQVLPSLKPLHEIMPAEAERTDTWVPGTGFHKQMELRHEPHYQDFTDVTEWLNEHDDGQGRVLVAWYVLGEHLAWRTETQILGGFHERNMEHIRADLFRRNALGDLPDEELEQYFRDYAVKWVIFTQERPLLETRLDMLEPIGGFPPYDDDGKPFHRIYATRVDVSFFAENDGRVEPSMNLLAVTGTDPAEDVVLRFHWLETLVCEPGCTIEREPISHDPVGFIRIKAPHSVDFDVVNRY